MLNCPACKLGLAPRMKELNIIPSDHPDKNTSFWIEKHMSTKALEERIDKYHVLIIHNHLGTLEMLSDMFHKFGYRVTTATDSVTALQFLSRIHVDLVFSDLDLPLLDGYDLAHLIRKRKASTKITVMTGRCQAELVELMAEGTIDGWLFKPFKLKAFSELLGDIGLAPVAPVRSRLTAPITPK